MSTISTYTGTDPNGNSNTMAQIQIGGGQNDLVLYKLNADGQYTLRFWINTSISTTISITVGSTSIASYDTNSNWTKCQVTFNGSKNDDVCISFDRTLTAYVWHAKIEVGNVATDFSTNTTQLSSEIKQTKDEISSKVSDTGAGEEFGWSLKSDGFSMYSGTDQKQVFKCNKDGLVINGNGTFNGTVYATDGEFSGKVTASSGEISGDLNITGSIGVSGGAKVMPMGVGGMGIASSGGAGGNYVYVTDDNIQFGLTDYNYVQFNGSGWIMLPSMMYGTNHNEYDDYLPTNSNGIIYFEYE